MKTIDFSQLGGFGLAQDDLAWMQDGYKDALAALGKKAGRGNPVILSGMVSTAGGGGSTDVSDGWFYYNGEIIQFNASTYAALTGANVALITIATTTSSVGFYDGSTPAVVINKTATVSAAASVTDATRVPLSAMYDDCTIEDGGAPDGATVVMDRSRTIFFYDSPLPSTNAITLDFTNARRGARLIANVVNALGSIASKSVSFAGSFVDINGTGTYTAGGGATAINIDVEYLGFLFGNHYVRITAADVL